MINQAQNASSNGTNNVPLTGEIFAVINDGSATTNGSTPSTCPQRTYWAADKNAFCASDMAAVAAAQVKIQDFLTYAIGLSVGQPPDTSVLPQIIRISSYDKQSPSHLLPDQDPASLTSMIAWLYTSPAIGAPPNTIFKLNNTSMPTYDQYAFLTDLGTVETMIESGSPTWQANYPVGEASQQPTISTLHGGTVLQTLFRYSCNAGTIAPSDYLTTEINFVPPPHTTCSNTGSIGNVALYPDPCMLFDPANNNAPYPYSNACPNAADIPVWCYKRTVGIYTQYYFTINQQDIVIQGGKDGWAPDQSGATFLPAFMVQPNWPRYQDFEPIGFEGGLRTNWGFMTGLAPQLSFFGLGTMTFGFQPTSNGNGNALAIMGSAGTRALICEPMAPGMGVDCPGDGSGTPLPCMPYDTIAPPLACQSAQGMSIMQSQYGGTTGSMGGSCCNAPMTSPPPPPGQAPIINFFPILPYLRVYSNDNSYVGPNGQQGRARFSGTGFVRRRAVRIRNPDSQEPPCEESTS